MVEGQSAAARERVVLVDGPLRLWHWLLAACLSFSLYTGLSGDLALVDWHMRSGYAICALLLFRLGWWFWGATYSRWHHYGFGWQGWRVWLGRAESSPRRVRTAPGAALSLTMIALLFLQAGAGLMTTDDIFTEGPLVRYAPEAWVSVASSVHRQLYYLVMGAVACICSPTWSMGCAAIRCRWPCFTAARPRRCRPRRTGPAGRPSRRSGAPSWCGAP